MEKTIKELKFEKAWACAALAEIRDALKAGRRLQADTVWYGYREDPITLLALIEGVLDNVGAAEGEAEQVTLWAIERAQRKAAGR